MIFFPRLPGDPSEPRAALQRPGGAPEPSRVGTGGLRNGGVGRNGDGEIFVFGRCFFFF